MAFFHKHRSAIATVIVIWTFAVTICRGIRLPNDFAEAHWLLDYRFGPVRRGLLGSLCSVSSSLLGFSMTSNLIVCLAALAFGGMCLSFAYASARMLRGSGERAPLWALLLIVASSPFVVMSGHAFGYLDSLVYLLAVASVALVLRGKPMAAGALSSISVLVHEAYLVIGVPLVFLGAVHALLKVQDGERRYATSLFSFGAPVVVFVALIILQDVTVDASTLRAQIAERLHSFDFVRMGADKIATWHTTSLAEYYLRESHLFSERLQYPSIFTSIAPAVVGVVTILHSAFRIRSFSFFSLTLLGVVGAPLAMHLVAWDTARISTFVIASGFLSAWILAECRGVQSSHNLYLLIALPALVLNVFGAVPLMDDEVERFSALVRLALYSPAIVFVVALIVQDVKVDALREFRVDDRST